MDVEDSKFQFISVGELAPVKEETAPVKEEIDDENSSDQ